MAKKKAKSATRKVAKKAGRTTMKVDITREKEKACSAFSANAFGGRCGNMGNDNDDDNNKDKGKGKKDRRG